MNKLTQFFCVLVLLLYSLPTSAQILYCLDQEEIGTLTINEDNTCSLAPILNLPLIEGENNSLPDITLHPNGKIYIVRGTNKLYEVDVKRQSFIYIDSIPVSSFNSITSLETDKNGLIYFSTFGSGFGFYNLQSKQATIRRDYLPKATGDLVFYKNYLLIGLTDRIIVKLDKETLLPVDTISLDNIISSFGGFAQEEEKLFGSNFSVGTGATNSPDTSRIYEINVEEKEATLVCQILGNPRDNFATRIFGLTSEHHFRNNFEMYLDLDANNSSGRFINHFEVDTFCTSIVPIADRDVQVAANFSIDSIVVQVETPNLSASEQILTDVIDVPNTIRLDKISATHIKISTNPNSTFSDIEAVLRQLKYDLQGNPSIQLERTIAFTMYGGDQVADIARTYLEVDLGRTPFSGADVDTTICPNRGFMALELLQGEDPGGYWEPPFSNNNPNIYLAQLDGPGVFQYITRTGECPADTAKMTVVFHEVDSLDWTIDNSLRFLCSEEDTVWVDISIEDEVTYYWRGLEASPVRPLTIEQEFNDFEIIDANGCVQSGAYYAVYREELQAVNTTEQRPLNLCEGEIYTLNGMDYSRDTIICTTYSRAISGCDSTYCIELSFVDAPLTVIDTSICYGEMYNFLGQEIGVSGVYNGTITRSGQCDSLLNLHLTVLPKNETIIDTLLKMGETIQFGNAILDEARTYTFNLIGENGCDSVVQITLDFTTSTQEIPSDTYKAALIPNPAYASARLKVESQDSEDITISIFNSNGSLIFQQVAHIRAGVNMIELDGNLPVGMYWAKVEGTRSIAYLKGLRL